MAPAEELSGCALERLRLDSGFASYSKPSTGAQFAERLQKSSHSPDLPDVRGGDPTSAHASVTIKRSQSKRKRSSTFMKRIVLAYYSYCLLVWRQSRRNLAKKAFRRLPFLGADGVRRRVSSSVYVKPMKYSVVVLDMIARGTEPLGCIECLNGKSKNTPCATLRAGSSPRAASTDASS